ncbi:RNA-directed RNA polymerase [Scaphoideus titanus reo-like virus 1]|nr:RNA-directed RNA polymerase [Scaphoideus titanus reo-like virus 1]
MKLSKESEKVTSIKYKSSDSAFSGGDFVHGLNLKLNSLDSAKMDVSRTSNQSLKSLGIRVPTTYTYENLPYVTMHQSFKNLRVEKDVSRLTNERLLSELLTSAPKKTLVKVTSKYPIYDLFDINYREYAGSITKGPIRYISTPIEGKTLESIIGSRCGIQFKNRGYGGSQEILHFIRRNGLVITEQQLIQLIIKSGVLGSINPRRTLVELFETISGDPASASELANFFMDEKPHWEDSTVSLTISGSLLENCDSRYERIRELVHVPAVYMQPDIQRMLTYIGYIYCVQRLILNQAQLDVIYVTIKDDKMMDFLMNSKPVSSRRNKKKGKTGEGDITNASQSIMEDPTVTGFHVRTHESEDSTINGFDSLLITHPLAIPFSGNQIDKYAVTQSEAE